MIQNYCSEEMSDEVQQSLATLINAINLARQTNQLDLIPSINIAFKAISIKNPNLIFANEIMDSVMADLKGGAKFSPPVQVVIGLVTLLFGVIPLLSSIIPMLMNQDYIFNIPTSLFFTVALFGAIGSIVSIMVRIQDFLTVGVKDRFILYFTGAFKPLIGMAFALFLLALIKSGWVPLDIKPETENYFFMAIAFIAGFSERFARDIVDNIETQIIEATQK
ncbi:MAG: hypothetical protein Q9M50_03940 [Methylococcales bacterium]|nr:hypothetical protein [Methylococcales bacterium]